MNPHFFTAPFIGLFHDEYRAFDVVDDILTDTPHDEGGDSALAAVADDDHIDALLLYDLRNSGTRDAGLYDLFIVKLDRDLFLQRSEQSFCLCLLYTSDAADEL